eukprot:CAMPEP_0117674636 /NCGR_PEP_ID=MMETSP0804-20121206/15147_1 /TAXON_ID=1074897 /ORGANISM="Tetraselmis astigmatica, Strain CCMP880" /LENGTH=173 /DNA_ID=CAMNT_0005483525 /DNA_START=93 /DNA_END=614 /DNA_ORIENTATION=-
MATPTPAEAAQLEVRVDSSFALRFVARADGAPVEEVIGTFPNAKKLREVLLEPQRVSPVVEERIREHQYIHAHPQGKALNQLGGCCCCLMPCFTDETKAWNMDRDADEVRKHVVALLAPLLHQSNYSLYESSGVWESNEHTFDPARGGLCVLRLYLSPRAAASMGPGTQPNLI